MGLGEIPSIGAADWRKDCIARPAMSIRVKTTSDTYGTVLKVDGRLTVEDVDELAAVFRTAKGATALDLSELQSADPAGVKLLQETIALGAEVRGASPYIELLLKTKS
jgi:ABC-type transporter Mla MlaB component